MEFSKFPAFKFDSREEIDMLTKLHAAKGEKPIVHKIKQGTIGCEPV